jgi:hypothetical protein
VHAVATPLIVEVLAPTLAGGTFPRVASREALGAGSNAVGGNDTYRLLGLLDRLRERFDGRIAVHLIEPLSFAWMVRVIRYRPRRYPAFLVGGREVVAGLDEPAVTRVIAALL